jgi:hypothetical protein
MIQFLFKSALARKLNTDAHPEFRTNAVLHFDFLEKGRRGTFCPAWPVQQKDEE